MKTAIILALCVVLSNASSCIDLTTSFTTPKAGSTSTQTFEVDNTQPYYLNSTHANTVSKVFVVITPPSTLTIKPLNQSLGAIAARSSAPGHFTVSGPAGHYTLVFTVHYHDSEQVARQDSFSRTFNISGSTRDEESNSAMTRSFSTRDNGCAAGSNTDFSTTNCLFADYVGESTWNTWVARVNTAQVYISAFSVTADTPMGLLNYTQSWTDGQKLALNATIGCNFDVLASGCGTYDIRFYLTYTKSNAPGSTSYKWNGNYSVHWISNSGCMKRSVADDFMALPTASESEANSAAFVLISYLLMALALLF